MVLESLKNSTEMERFKKIFLEADALAVENLGSGAAALTIAKIQETTRKNILIVTSGARDLLNDLPFFGIEGRDFPAYETLPGEDMAPSKDIIGKRLEILFALIESKKPEVVVVALPALLQKIPAFDDLQLEHIKWKVGDTAAFEKLHGVLQNLGYEAATSVVDKGQYTLRGGLLDIYPASSLYPYRIDFFGDQIEEIRLFNPLTQKSLRESSEQEKVTEIFIPPTREQRQDSPPPTHLLIDYLEDPIIIFDDILLLENHYREFLKLPGASSEAFASMGAIFSRIKPLKTLFLSKENLSNFGVMGAPNGKVTFEWCGTHFTAGQWIHPFIDIADGFSPFEEASAVHGSEIFAGIAQAPKDLAIHLIAASDVDARVFQEKVDDAAPDVKPILSRGYLSSGFLLEESKIALIPYTEITHRYRTRRARMRGTYQTPTSEFHELTAGDYVVHFNHGIGKFLGVKNTTANDGSQKEMMLIEYASHSQLSVPVSDSHLVSRYIGASEDKPELSKLGTKKWQQTKLKAQSAIVGYAKDLLEISAKREIVGGFACPSDGAEMVSFEEEFPYTETEDQLGAIAAIKGDMESGVAMDRLICGDVGYGKTEVAMRAAFKAAMDGGKQVAVLVPTTVLAMQHYESFSARMDGFPVRVGVVSRFCKKADITQTLQDVADGKIDILIGTHRIISADVKFKDLGLVIIDEEQRFGVKAKEKLKSLASGVDYLTLSATPIPRTLYLSLVGARSISTISTPPQDRLPIQTFISKHEAPTIQNAILRELTRDGQVYFIHNRVETIYEKANYLQKLVPSARIVIGHGQMDADALDTVFHTFKSGQADILVATTIIENGIDIPKANTILIDNADMFGLADLYQLRGRVGRWNRPSYAYFLISATKMMPELAMKRLYALKESSGHGGGMRIAMRDLELRGAGEILGVKQSGQISSVGFHLYCKLLARAVKGLKESKPPVFSDTQMEFFIEAKLPASYIPESSIRMELYHRLGEALTSTEIDDLFLEIADRFGKIPEQALWLKVLTRIKLLASSRGISHIKIEKSGIKIRRGALETKLPLPPTLSPSLFEQGLTSLLH